MTHIPYEKTPHGALSKLFDQVTVVCHTCNGQMRFMGEWTNRFPKEEHNIHQSLRWTCITCRVPSEEYHRGMPVYAAFLIDGPLLELGRKLAEEN